MTTASIKQAFQGAFDEIARRSKVSSSMDPTAVSHFPLCTPTPFDEASQAHVLVSMGTDVLAPRPADPCRPALRVYGAF